MMVRFIWLTGFLVLLLTEVLRIYFIMPFPGSQQWNTVNIAYFLHQYAWYFRLGGILILLIPAYMLIRQKSIRAIIVALLPYVVWAGLYFVVREKMQADKMFYQPTKVRMATVSENVLPRSTVVIGISLNGSQHAYPVELIGYHHQVRDTVGGEPVMVTYCTVCRTGRIFSPIVNGVSETFRLVGMDHFNAMFEDSRTKSWWRQVNGEAVAGPLKGMRLNELPYEQMTLDAWIARYPNTLILQPDSVYADEYAELAGYATGKKKGKLTGTDSLSWRDKSWVIGVTVEGMSRAYDWRELLNKRLIHDRLTNTSLLLTVEPDGLSFHVWERPDTLLFYLDDSGSLRDQNTNSLWNWSGKSTEGALQGTILKPVQAHQEYWHSWRTFHPSTTRYPQVP
ncbi:MAG: DUF3179 domain-containing protein [Cyclobacteriaceae bacterium]|nr:DUF3179 domain-containing protein [Cyclobacteriaceae bacterium]MDW8332042.1 DUF3179 domain-containing (seleno)protein [Cyclobacteriaceae bacterium]